MSAILRRSIPKGLRRALVPVPQGPARPAVDLGRLKPLSANFGFDRGQLIDRYFIEVFLGRHAADIRGRVLEIGSDRYTRAFGGDGVDSVDALHVARASGATGIVGDLTMEGRRCDCVVLTQTLSAIYDVEAAIATVERLLEPGVVVLVTVPGITKVCRHDMDRWGFCGSFTTASARRAFESAFPAESIDVVSYGNVASAVGFLHGLAAEELPHEALEHHDPDYQLLIGLRVRKTEGTR